IPQKFSGRYSSIPYSRSPVSAHTTCPTRHLYGASMATRTSIFGSSGTVERIFAPCRFTRIVSAAPLTWDPSLFWPETAKASETRTRELLRPRSCAMSCAICLFADTLGISGNYRTFGQLGLYYRQPPASPPKSGLPLSQGNLGNQYLLDFLPSSAPRPCVELLK